MSSTAIVRTPEEDYGDAPGFLWTDKCGEMVRVGNKTYIRIPGGEVQVGHASGSVVVWLDHQKHVIREASVSGS